MPDTSVWGTCLSTEQLIHSPLEHQDNPCQGQAKQLPEATARFDTADLTLLQPGQGTGNSQLWEETLCSLSKG